MTTVNMDKVKEVAQKLDSIIQGVNQIAVLRDRVESAMVQVVDPEKVKAILDKESSVEILTEEETISFFRVIFNQIKDETFNPTNFIIEESSKATKGKMFHAKFKERFLDEHRVGDKPYAEETKRVARVLFGKIASTETYYNKDVYDFNSNQFEEILVLLKATTLRSLQNSISTLEQYIDFAIKEGRVSAEKGNVAFNYNNAKDITGFLDKKAQENMIFTKKDIDFLSGYAENAQDGVILSLIFDGVSYKRKFVELRNIRIQDVDMDNLVINIPQLVDEDTGEVLPKRNVPISNETARMIRSAMDEKKYASLKGVVKRNYSIAESDYILRGLRMNYQIKWENVSQRILRIAELENYPYLNATNIAYSGQIHYARELMEKGLSIDEACAEMIKRFNLSDNESAHFYLKARIEKANNILAN